MVYMEPGAPAERGRADAAALGVSVVLAAIGGFVDAVGFARLLGVFPANQSGNVVFLGMAIGGASPAPAWRTTTAIVTFAIGTGAGFLLGRRIGNRHKAPVLLAVELLLLLALIAVAGPVDDAVPAPGLEGAVLIVLASLAMGVQTEVIRHVAGVGVATTYQSGAVARIGEAMTGPLRGGDPPRRYATKLGILVLVLVAYIGGAAAGASALGQWRWSFTVPGAALAVLVAAWVIVPRRLEGVSDAGEPAGD
jgi:uncharacterized membrane protein YoaK (UPF0700 family)